MGLFNPYVSCENDSAILALVSLLPLPRPPKKKTSTTYPKRLPIKTSPQQCAVPGIDPMSTETPSTNQLCGPRRRFVTGTNKRHVLTPSRTRL